MELHKKFGLVIPPKRKPNTTTATATAASVSVPSHKIKPSIFVDDADVSDPKEATGKQKGHDTTEQLASKSKTPFTHLSSYRHEETEAVKKKALQQDPHVFDYDASYDSIQEKRKQQRFVESSGPGPKKPKYIENLLKRAAEKKLEDEKAVERKVQKERELEGDQFKDKEQFMTAGYKKKLEELKRQEDEERKKLAAEEDVTKKSDLTDFYRNILNESFDRGRK